MIASFLRVLLALAFLSSPASAQLVFEDRSGYQNFQVRLEKPRNGVSLQSRTPDRYEFDVSRAKPGALLKFVVTYQVPMEEGSTSFDVTKPEVMAVDVVIAVTESFKDGYVIPVYYFDCIGACGFGQIDPINDAIVDRVFERYFKASQMAQHYFLRMNTKNTGVYRRSVQLWRDASYQLGAHTFDWWRMSGSIVWASAEAFVNDPSRHRATERYFKEVNGDQ